MELTGKTGDAAQIVSGAGINLVMRRVESDVVNQGWISLQEAGVVIDRNLLAARLIKSCAWDWSCSSRKGWLLICRAGKNWITLFIVR